MRRRIIQSYEFRNNGKTKYSVDAQVVGEELEAISNKHGTLNPHVVVKAAERKKEVKVA